jgi:signal transduction histidine kinase
MSPATSIGPHPVGLRLVRGGTPAITDVTVDHARLGSARSPEVSTADRERLALAILVDGLSNDPGRLLQTLVDVVTGVFGAGAAAVALTEGDARHWDAAAGPLADSPRWTAFHGAIVARHLAELQARLRHDPALRPATSPVPHLEDSQAIPLRYRDATIGVLWVAARSGGATIAPGELRAMRVLAQLAASGWISWTDGESARTASLRKSEFLAMVSHELRNPLNAIATAAALLPTGGVGGDAAAVIARQCQFMSRLVTDLFDTARVDHRKLDLQLTTLDVRAAVVETLATRRQQLERQGLTLSLDLGDTPLCVDADPVRFVQMLSNLIDNAIKYTARGGRVAVSLRHSGIGIELTVNDTGYGLQADQLAGIFEPFTQIERSARVNGGLGLGLPLARSLAELHGGSLQASSPGLGLGSSFVLTLPAGVRRLSGVRGPERTTGIPAPSE